MVFILSALCWRRIRGLWKLSDRKLGLVLMGRAKLTKSLIQFSVDGQGCVPSLLLGLRPTVVGVMATFFKRSHAGTAALSAPDPVAGHH